LAQALHSVLLVDDDQELADSVSRDLTGANYRVTHSASLDEAYRIFKDESPDIVILDIALEATSRSSSLHDGIDLLRKIRFESGVPIIMLTGTNVPTVKVLTLELGADDYVTKPFHPAELVARVGAVLRRAGAGTDSETFLGGRLQIDRAARLLKRDGEEVHLTPTEFELLDALIVAKGRALSRRQLLDSVRSVEHFGDERMVDVHIRHIRTKVEDDPSAPLLVMTVRGVGYRWNKA